MSDRPVAPLSPFRDPQAGGRAGRVQLWLRNGLTAIFLMYAFSQVAGLSVFDSMMLSGSATTVAGLWLGVGVRTRMHAAVDMLRQSGALLLTPAQLGALHRLLDTAGARIGRASSVITALAEVTVVISGTVLVPWLIFGVPPVRSSEAGLSIGVIDAGVFVGLLIVSVPAAAVIGWYMGQFAGYGRLPALISEAGGRLRGHAQAGDRVGGLRPLVSFVWRQATLSLLPMLWIGTWLVLTAFDGLDERYGFWRFSLFLLFGLSVLYAVQGFWAPARMLVQLFDQQLVAAGNDAQLARAISAARRGAGPVAAAFIALATVLSLAIVGAALLAWSKGGWSRALFGPPL